MGAKRFATLERPKTTKHATAATLCDKPLGQKYGRSRCMNSRQDGGLRSGEPNGRPPAGDATPCGSAPARPPPPPPPPPRSPPPRMTTASFFSVSRMFQRTDSRTQEQKVGFSLSFFCLSKKIASVACSMPNPFEIDLPHRRRQLRTIRWADSLTAVRQLPQRRYEQAVTQSPLSGRVGWPAARAVKCEAGASR